MKLSDVTTPELLGLIDNRFDILTNDGIRHSGPTLSWQSIECFGTKNILKEKKKAIGEIYPLLKEYESRVNGAIAGLAGKPEN